MAIISFINRKPIRARNRALKPQYEGVLIRQIGKIRLIWGYLEKEPDTGFFWGDQKANGAQIEPGLCRVCKEAHRKNGWIGGDRG
jgi:hypothetical protein